jgi:hypothetical protein
MRAAIGSAFLVCAFVGTPLIPTASAQEAPVEGPTFVGIVAGELRVGPREAPRWRNGGRPRTGIRPAVCVN